MNTKNFEGFDTVDQVLALLGRLSRTEKMIIARKIESEMIDFKLTEMDFITTEVSLQSQQSSAS
ncbi:MAG: hypothetical protein GVY17_04585 [Cyanobacteria bacterium]|jgi:hypothetical protein|nr:hypothetical protein [Cyanobacteria bacterium GSL.Bin21]